MEEDEEETLAAMRLSHQLVIKECVWHTSKMERKGDERAACCPPPVLRNLNYTVLC